jgi:hypothetical protein
MPAGTFMTAEFELAVGKIEVEGLRRAYEAQ